MSPISSPRTIGLPLVAVALLLASTTATAFAHARYERSDPMAGVMIDASPTVLRAWYTQELMLRSAIAVVDEAGNQVDLGDGRVDQDDPSRKTMVVSLPPLPVGVYWVYYVASSADDGHDEVGSFTFGIGMLPPVAEASTTPIAAAESARSADNLTGEHPCASTT
jgi:methionine-rich copper-binding protein CopC